MVEPKSSEKFIHELIELKKAIHTTKLQQNRNSIYKELALHVIYKNSKDSMISVADFRKNMKLAPSTITSILTDLENQGFIKRIIDKTDRRNICIKITKLGIDNINTTHQIFIDKINKYIEYMGKNDIESLINIINKTIQYLNGGKFNEDAKK